jgi:hypothetical protein
MFLIHNATKKLARFRQKFRLAFQNKNSYNRGIKRIFSLKRVEAFFGYPVLFKNHLGKLYLNSKNFCAFFK